MCVGVCVVCVPCRDSGDCLVLVLVLSSLHWLSTVVSGWLAMWFPDKERAERVLASAISIDGRKEGTCKFCSESNVWMALQALLQ